MENEARVPAAAHSAARPAQEPVGQRVYFSTLRMPPGGRLQSHLQGTPPNPQPTAQHPDSVSSQGQDPREKFVVCGGARADVCLVPAQI